MASDVPSQTNTHKRPRHQNQSSAPSKHDHPLATDFDSQLIEIEETQLSVQHRDDPRFDMPQVSMPLLVHPSLQSSTFTSRTGVTDALSTCLVEMTLNPELFWGRVLQQTKYPSADRQPTEHTYLVLVDWSHDTAVTSALGFLSLNLERIQEWLDSCASCKILFAEWNIMKLLAPELKERTKQFQKHVKAFSTIRHGIITFGSGTGCYS